MTPRTFGRLAGLAFFLGLAFPVACQAQVPDSIASALAEGRGGVGDVVPASEVTQPYSPPMPIYAGLWRRVGVQCLHLSPDDIPPLSDWSWYSVDAKAFTSVWSGDNLIVAVTDGPGHRIFVVRRKVSASGTIAHEMLHAMLFALGREWKAVHPSAERTSPPTSADHVFDTCNLWPVPDSW